MKCDKLYGIIAISTGKLLTLSSTAVEGECMGNYIRWELCRSGDAFFLHKDRNHVEDILNGRTKVEWYNSTAENPLFRRSDYSKEVLENFHIAEIDITVIY